jgi:hypothetical protein
MNKVRKQHGVQGEPATSVAEPQNSANRCETLLTSSTWNLTLVVSIVWTCKGYSTGEAQYGK